MFGLRRWLAGRKTKPEPDTVEDFLARFDLEAVQEFPTFGRWLLAMEHTLELRPLVLSLQRDSRFPVDGTYPEVRRYFDDIDADPEIIGVLASTYILQKQVHGKSGIRAKAAS